MKLIAAVIGLGLCLFTLAGRAAENPLVGTWKLKSYVWTTTEGKISSVFGEHPTGYLSYSADGRMYAMGTAEGRRVPHDIVPSDAERLELYKTMFAYAGTYSVEPDKVVHHIDNSWNQIWNGTDQIRFYKLAGNTLTITSARASSPYDGQEGQFVLLWEKVEEAR
jgi:hypothetical protein